MNIGIDASKVVEEKKTGVGNTVSPIIFEMAKIASEDQLSLYAPDKLPSALTSNANVKGEIIRFPKLWHKVALPWKIFWRRPDVLLEMSSALPTFSPKHAVILLHDFAFKYFPAHYSKLERYFQESTVKSAIKKAEIILFTTETNRKDFFKFYHFPKERTHVVPLAYDSDVFNLEDKGSTKAGYNYFLSVGRFEKRKNTLATVNAFEIFKKKAQSSHKLVLVGYPSYGWEEIDTAINNSRYRSDIIIRNYVKAAELANLYRQADALVYPSFYEGFGYPMLEAFACGTLVIASKIDNLKEVGGDAPFYVDPDNEEEIAETMYKVAFKEGDYKRKIESGLKTAHSYNWAKTAQQIYNIIKKIK